jgi:hypothetical protein
MDESPEIIATNPALSISDIDATSTEYPIHVDDEGDEEDGSQQLRRSLVF